MEKVLSLDISSVCVGYALFHDLDLVKYGKFLQVGKKHGQKLFNFSIWLEQMFLLHKPDHVVIELPHGGNGKVLRILTQYTATVLMVHYKVFQRELLFPSHQLYPSTIKALLKTPRGKNHDENKSIMVEFINNLLGLNLAYKLYDPHKTQTEDDIADAIAVGIAWLIRSKRDDGRYYSKPNNDRKPAKKTKKRG